ncbi:MAG: DUF4321 domain-containing protein [Endomicrobiaceae bacterium]|jgi:hypothetical protein|nr:DUF4321 domain-containing protein [Endomicrobiaceae bacterium]MDD3729899.1 DUF4321 domain-containing protein [Endomicrobiaceae bacterium]MDD4166085.1 DUF4321 domain-containing protein [Endomicrobiaceae bacterium]
MLKNPIMLIIVLVVGALLGSFLGELISIVLPSGAMKDLFIKDLSAGLMPSTFDLRIVQITFGCMLKLNVMSLVGVILSAFIFRKIYDK